MSRAEQAIIAQQYRIDCRTWIYKLPPHIVFTADDVRAEFGDPPSPGITGAVMNAASRAGEIEWTGKMVKSTTPGRHTNLNRLWRRV